MTHYHQQIYDILPSAVIWHTTISSYMAYYHQQLYDILPSAVIWHTTISSYMTYYHQQLYGILPSAVIWHTTISCNTCMTYYHQQLYDILPSTVIWHTTISSYMAYWHQKLYLTITRRRRSEYWWIFPEKKLSGIFTNIQEPEANNCFSIITQVIIEIPKQRNVLKFYHNLPLLIRVHTTLLASMCHAMPFRTRALKKKKHCLRRSYR